MLARAFAEDLAARADAVFERGRAQALDTLPCARGCHACCIGPFPITSLDAARLTEAVAQLPLDLAQHIRTRADEQITAYETAFPQLRRQPHLDEWDDAEIDRLVSQFSDRPCPALLDDGACAVYVDRPITCRLMGLPVQEGSLVQGPCSSQPFVPITGLGRSDDESQDFAAREAGALAAHRALTGERREEWLLPYGFLPKTRASRR
ncbi:MAG: YkgJ family cysteine cluster protein [Nitrospiraceae bacterium]